MKALFQGKRKYVMIGAIVVVAVIALIMSRRRTQTVYVESGGGGEMPIIGGGGGGGVSQGDLRSAIETTTEALQVQFTEALERQSETFQRMFETQSQALSALASQSDMRFAQLSQSFGSAIEQISGSLVNVQSSLMDRIAATESKFQMLTPPPSPTYGGASTSTPAASGSYSSGSSSGGSSKTTTSTTQQSSKSNQIIYLENTKAQAKASGNEGLAKWANQALYLENTLTQAKASGNVGLQKWAQAELNKLYAKK